MIDINRVMQEDPEALAAEAEKRAHMLDRCMGQGSMAGNVLDGLPELLLRLARRLRELPP